MLFSDHQNVNFLLKVSVALLVLSLTPTSERQLLARALENGLARTPPMGWLAWERFTCQVDCVKYPNDCIDTQLFKQITARLFNDKWLQLGYEYVHIDDCWSELERSSGRLVADKKRFSRGLKSLADFVHQHLGLKLGLYGDCGTKTCAGYPGQLKFNNTHLLLEARRVKQQSLGVLNEAESFIVDKFTKQDTYFQLDAQTFADWHIDSLKFDGCHVDPLGAERVCSQMAHALAQTKRPIMLICEWPFYMMYAHAEPDYELAAASCNVWRYYDDIEDSWLSILNTIDYTVKHQETIVKYHGPGHWFDPDQLVIGNFGLSVGQARAQMALWCVWAAPLFMSNDLRSIRREFVAILQNERLIAVNQDKLGVFGLMTQQAGDYQAFVKPLEPIQANGCPSFAIVYLNRKTLGNKQKVSFKLSDILSGAPLKQAAKNQAQVVAFERQRGQNAAHNKYADHPLDSIEQSNGAEQAINLIKPNECLELLKKGDKKHLKNSQNTDDDDDEVQFEMTDLFADELTDFDRSFKLTQRYIKPSESLELLVAPSSVRAVLLIQRE